MSTRTFWASFGISSNVPSPISLFLSSFGPVNIIFIYLFYITHTSLLLFLTSLLFIHGTQVDSLNGEPGSRGEQRSW